MKIRFARQAAFRKAKPKKTDPPKRETPKYILPYGLDKTSATEAGTTNRIIDGAITKVVGGNNASGEAAPLARLSKPSTRFSALRGLTFNEICDAYIAHFPARRASN